MTWWGGPAPHESLSTSADLAKPLPPELAKQLADGLLPPQRMAQAIDYVTRTSPPVNPDPARFAVVKNWSGGYGLAAIPQANQSAAALVRERATWGDRVRAHFRGSIPSSIRVPESMADRLSAGPAATMSRPVLDARGRAVANGQTEDLDARLRGMARPNMTGYCAGGTCP